MQKNLELTEELIRIVEPVAQECFRNSVLALYAYRGDLPAVYVEGWVAILDGKILIEHSWIEVGEQLVDITLTDIEPQYYLSGCRFSRGDLDGKRRGKRVLRLPLSFFDPVTRDKARQIYKQVHYAFYGVG